MQRQTTRGSAKWLGYWFEGYDERSKTELKDFKKKWKIYVNDAKMQRYQDTKIQRAKLGDATMQAPVDWKIYVDDAKMQGYQDTMMQI